MSANKNSLSIFKARENNLKAIDLELPHDSFVGITGLSGSGKSSLAFDTIYAEGQRRYIETFSPYTRQFFDKVKRPKVDLIDNVRPAIAIQQRTRILNSRSTVGSMTDINDFLKIIWSNVAVPVCPRCGMKLKRWDGEKLTSTLSSWCEVKLESTFLIGILTANKGDNIDRLQTLGYSRYLNPATGELLLFEDAPPRKKDKQIFVAIDRCRNGAFNPKRIKDSIEQCFSIGDGTLSVVELKRAPLRPLSRLSAYNEPVSAHPLYETYSFSREFQCGDAALTISRPRPALFSYNHPIGACSECNGFGKVLVIDPHRCVPDHSKTIANYAVECWKGNAASGEHRQLLSFCRRRDIPIDKPWASLSDAQRDEIFNHKSREYVGRAQKIQDARARLSGALSGTDRLSEMPRHTLYGRCLSLPHKRVIYRRR
jgi:excinuclease ABC subunit A